MGTMFHTDNSGVIVFLGSMILLVFAGVFITLAMDGSVGMSGKGDPTAVLERGEERIAELEASCQKLEAKKIERAQHQALAERVVATKGELEKWEAKKLDLRTAVRDAGRDAERVQSEFDDYSERFRSEIRRKAAGTKLDELTTLGGKIYHDVEIKFLTRTELGIAHRNGGVQIPIAELSPEFRARYHLDLGEAARVIRERRKAEQERIGEQQKLIADKAKAEAERLAQEKKNRRPGARVPIDPDTQLKIDLLANKIQGLQELAASNQNRISSARAQLGGGDRSPPGSLQTWEQRVRSLQQKQGQIEGALRQAESEMRALNPNYRRGRLRSN